LRSTNLVRRSGRVLGRRIDSMRNTTLAAVALTASMALQSSAADADPRFGRWDATSAFFIRKSENRNEVHYAVRLDAQCAFVGAHPVFAYWQMKESKLPHVEDLLPREEQAYGVAAQVVSNAAVRMTLQALPDRVIVVTAAKREGGCVASATVAVRGAFAPVDHVFVQLAWPFGVSFFELVGPNAAWTEKVRR